MRPLPYHEYDPQVEFTLIEAQADLPEVRGQTEEVLRFHEPTPYDPGSEVACIEAQERLFEIRMGKKTTGLK